MKYLGMNEILVKACTNLELSEEEKLQLDAWLNNSAKNRKIFNQLKLTILYPKEDRINQLKQEGWNDLNREISFSNRINGKPTNLRLYWLKIAAILVICVSTIFIAYQTQFLNQSETQLVHINTIEKISLSGQQITTTLPDGTVVKLNAESKIIVPELFLSDKREVMLEGEAFFVVARDESKPFVIKTNDLEITVLGTSFNVNAYDDIAEPSVSVKSGKVAVKHSGNEEMVSLEPNEMVSLNTDGQLLKQVISNTDLSFGWTEHKLVFEENSIAEVFNTISKWYGIKIDLKGDLAVKKPYTANYSNPTLEEVLKSLSHVYQFNYKNNGKKVSIY